MANYATCGTCDNPNVLVKKDGSLWKHSDLDGTPCPGADAKRESDVKGVEKHQDYEAPQDPWSNLRKEPEPEAEGVFQYEIVVKAPCPYLDEQEWNLANSEIVKEKAREAGHNPRGDAWSLGHEQRGKKIHIAYAVKI